MLLTNANKVLSNIKMKGIDKNLKGLIVDDHEIFRDGLNLILGNQLNVDLEEFGDGQSLLNRLEVISSQNLQIDFITTDINHPNIDGLELIKKIRNIPDNVLYHNGLRLKYVPIVVITTMDGDSIRNAITEISTDIIHHLKNTDIENLTKNIIKSVAQYRNKITEEFSNGGFSIQFEDGKYNICKTYDLAPFLETKYFEGMSNSASKALTRKILIQNTSSVAKISISIFEDLINQPKTKEKDFQEFFRLFPEFLLENNYDVLYSEKSIGNSFKKYRTDIVAQPRGLHLESDKWALIELKKHTEQILTNTKYHANFSKVVYNAIRQLKNYQEYYSDPRNTEEIKKNFNGILPNPKMCLLIGRTPKGKENLFRKMRSQFPEICITTYDEVLNFRKIYVQYMETLGL
jgi:CheY-like chemotaxis protein